MIGGANPPLRGQRGIKMVKQTTIHKFVTKQGYELVEKFGKSETSRALKISRPTIDAILREFPTAPKSTVPKYVFQWEETTGNKLFVEKYQGRLGQFRQYIIQGMKAWLLLGKKDPCSWDVEDFRRIWSAEQFRDSMTQKIGYENAVFFRKWMRASGNESFCDLEEFATDGLKRPKGIRKQWFLEDEEITRLIETTDRPDLIVSFVVALLSGGRASSIMKCNESQGIRPMDIDERNYGILMYEPKRKNYVLRFFHPRAIELLKKYIADSETKPNEPLFAEYQLMRKRLKQSALKARVAKIAQVWGAWHITKHTFVSQGAYHGLSIEVISEQAGTDANTLMQFYAGIKEKKMRAELLGEQVDIEPFHVWALRVIIEPAIKRYEQLTVTNGDK